MFDKSLLPHWMTSLNVTNFITDVRNCLLEATPMFEIDLII